MFLCSDCVLEDLSDSWIDFAYEQSAAVVMKTDDIDAGADMFIFLATGI